jgi:hypothetical protein
VIDEGFPKKDAGDFRKAAVEFASSAVILLLMGWAWTVVFGWPFKHSFCAVLLLSYYVNKLSPKGKP